MLQLCIAWCGVVSPVHEQYGYTCMLHLDEQSTRNQLSFQMLLRTLSHGSYYTASIIRPKGGLTDILESRSQYMVAEGVIVHNFIWFEQHE
jgi:hypothetical protein